MGSTWPTLRLKVYGLPRLAVPARLNIASLNYAELATAARRRRPPPSTSLRNHFPPLPPPRLPLRAAGSDVPTAVAAFFALSRSLPL